MGCVWLQAALVQSSARCTFHGILRKAARVSGLLPRGPGCPASSSLSKGFRLSPGSCSCHRWVPESIRWMVLSGKSLKALRILQWVAAFNGRKEAGEKLSLEVGAGGEGGVTCRTLGSALGLCPPPACCVPAHKLLSRHRACTFPSPCCQRFTHALPPPFAPRVPQELKLDLQKEISLAKAGYSVVDLFRTPVLRRVTFCLSLAW